MTLRIKRPHGPATEHQLATLEADLAVVLPEPYRDFLRKVGGGRTGDQTVPNTNGMGVLMEIHDALGTAKYNSAERRTRGFIEAVPRHYIVISRGAGGEAYLRVRDGDEGSVWWADYDKAGAIDDEEPHQEIMIRLADDFEAFLEMFPDE